MDEFTPQVIDRFWSRVQRSDDLGACWPWIGYHDRDGYGGIFIKGKNYRASRLAYILTNGAVPQHLKVCHRCDNPTCCNPAHLFLATQRENIDDMRAKGRNVDTERWSEINKAAYLKRDPSKPWRARFPRKHSDELVRAIREAYANGEGGDRKLARRFGVHRGYVRSIRTNKIRRE